MFICFILPARKLIMKWIKEVKTEDGLWQEKKNVCMRSKRAIELEVLL